MIKITGNLSSHPCLDSAEMGESRTARVVHSEALRNCTWQVCGGRTVREGFYLNKAGVKVDWYSLPLTLPTPPRSVLRGDDLPTPERITFRETEVQVSNETTFLASRRLIDSGLSPLALNFANGVHPGGGFLQVRDDRKRCCVDPAPLTLVDDPMYEHHRARSAQDSTDWAIYSPNVPVFRNDDGTALDQPWLLSFLTCAAPYAPAIGQPQSGDLLEKRIHRVLAIARAYGHTALVLGAWGCGAFANDPRRTAVDFRKALETEFSGAFFDIVFAITDWSAERRILGPFRDVFSS